jgi:hypothetical protein
MATYYADGTLTTGNNNGTSWADAWQGEAGLQFMLGVLTAGDIGRIRNTFTLTSPMEVNEHAGSNNGSDGSPIRVIGCAPDGSEDGTKAVIDANGAAANCLLIGDRDHWFFQNVEFKDATSHVICGDNTDNLRNWVFQRCDIHGSTGGSGCYPGATKFWYYSKWLECRCYSNNGAGIERLLAGCTCAGCTIRDNGSHGINANNQTSLVDCIIHHNGTEGSGHGVIAGGYGIDIIGCVIDGNHNDGIYVTDGPCLVRLCRLTNNGGYGINISSATVLDRCNFFSGNGSGEVNGSAAYPNDKGSTTRLTSGTVGYEDLPGDKFNLLLGAAGYRTEIDMGGGACRR